MTNPIYRQTIQETGINPEQVSAKCSSLESFKFDRAPAQAPRPGQKPVRRKKKS